MGAVPKLKKMSQQYADQGLVIIGVHSTKGSDKMAGVVEAQSIPYPVATDISNKTTGAYSVDGFPDYHIIDRSGNLRVADLKNGDLERTIQILLAEMPTNNVHPALVPASEKAHAKSKRILTLWADDASAKAWSGLYKKDRSLGKLLSNEFELVKYKPGMEAGLAQSLGLKGPAPTMAALDWNGKLLASQPIAGLTPETLRDFLTENRVPAKDAETILAEALEKATRANKRVMVNLGAPW